MARQYDQKKKAVFQVYVYAGVAESEHMAIATSDHY